MAAKDDARQLAQWLTANASAKGSSRYQEVAGAFRKADALAGVEDTVGGMFAPKGPQVPNAAEITGLPQTADQSTTSYQGEVGYKDPLGMIRDQVVGTGVKLAQGASLGWADDIAGAVIPGADRAIRREGEKFAEINPAGAAAAETAGMLGTAVAATPAALSAPLNLGGRLLRGTTLGTTLGAVQGAGNTDGDIQQRIEGAKTGAMIGGAGGLIFETGAPLALRMMNGPRPAAIPAARQIADSLPVPIPMSAGQALDDVGLLNREFAMARGAEGNQPATIMRDFAGKQQGAILANRDALQEQLARGGPVVSRNDGGAMVAGRLGEMRDAENARIGTLYDTARDTGGTSFVSDGTAKGIAQRMADRIKADHAPENVPKITREIDRLYGRNEQVTVRELFETRGRLNGARAGGGEDAVAAGKAIRELDTALDDAYNQALISGDDTAINAFREANAAYKDFAGRFKSDDLIPKIIDANPQEAANLMFNAGRLSVNRKGLYDSMAKLEKMLGKDSAEWNGVRQEFFVRLGDDALNSTGPNGSIFSGAKLHKAWTAPENQPVIKAIYSPEERRAIGNWVETARRVTVKDPNVYAPSVSPFTMRRLMGMGSRIAEKVPVFGQFLAGLRQTAEEAMSAAAASRLTSGRLPTPAVKRQGAPAALLAAPTAIDYQRSGRQ